MTLARDGFAGRTSDDFSATPGCCWMEESRCASSWFVVRNCEAEMLLLLLHPWRRNNLGHACVSVCLILCFSFHLTSLIFAFAIPLGIKLLLSWLKDKKKKVFFSKWSLTVKSFRSLSGICTNTSLPPAGTFLSVFLKRELWVNMANRRALTILHGDL